MYRSNVLELLRVLGTHNFGTWSHCCWVSKIGTKFLQRSSAKYFVGSKLRPSRLPSFGCTFTEVHPVFMGHFVALLTYIL